MDVRVRFFGKIQIRISESKNGFWVFLGISKNGSWIHKIHTQGGFFGSNPNPDFWDSQSERFFGKGFEKYFWQAVFRKKMVWTYVGGVLLSLSHIIPCLSSIQIIGRLFLNPYLSCFLYVCRVCLRRFIFQVKKKNSSALILNSNDFTILRGVFYARNVCVSNRNTIHFVYSFLAYVSFSSCLRREDRFVVAIFFFLSRSTRTCRWHSKWSFFGSSVFLVVTNPYDLRS